MSIEYGCIGGRCSFSFEDTNDIETRKVVSGVTQEECRFEWKVENFDVVRKVDSILESQRFEFTAGDSIGLPSKWCFSLGLTPFEDDGSNNLIEDGDEVQWVTIFHKLLEAPPDVEAIFTQCEFTIKEKGTGRLFVNSRTDTVDMIDLEKKDGWGCQLFSNELHEGCLPLDDRDLIVQCKFRVFANRPKPVTLDGVPPECHTKFRDMFLDRLKEDLSTLRVAKIPCNDVKIISKDKKEFVAQKGILAVRSEVFEAMFRSTLKEEQSGIIELDDLSGKTVNVLLDYIYSAKINPDWCEPSVIVEFTYAAGKYQFAEVLQFLDEEVGKYCDLSNVGSLLSLASNLALRNAEAVLLNYIKVNGIKSAENFFKVFGSINLGEHSFSAFKSEENSISTDNDPDPVQNNE